MRHWAGQKFAGKTCTAVVTKAIKDKWKLDNKAKNEQSEETEWKKILRS